MGGRPPAHRGQHLTCLSAGTEPITSRQPFVVHSARCHDGPVRRSSAGSWGLAGAALAFGLFATVLSALAGSDGDPWWLSAVALTAITASICFGLLIALRRPGNRIGLLLLVNALVLACAGFAEYYAKYALITEPGALPGARWAALWDSTTWPLLFAAVTAIALIFPSGRLPSARWRRPTVAIAAAFPALIAAGAFSSDPLDAPFEHVSRPLPALPGAVLAPLWLFGILGVLAGLVAGAWAIQGRFRRAVGVERLQLKWLAYAAGLIPLTVAICLAEALILGTDGTALTVSLMLMFVTIPVAVGVAVLRYRLYDIDRLINRTAVYVVLTALLAGAYGATTVVLAVAAGGDSRWTTAAATLLVALLFRPLRARVQDVVDRRFNRARYEGIHRIERFLADLRGGRAAPEEIEGVLGAALGDPGLELHYWLPESEAYADRWGRPVDEAHEDGRARLPVHRAGAPLAIVLHDPALDARPDLRAGVVEAAGLAIEIARLRVELRRQLDEVDASRARIVAAGDEERRRIERDLHDGAQQRLVTVGLALRHVQHELDPEAERTGAALDGAVSQIGLAISDLRELARGVRPARLDDGLAAALHELGGRAALPVEVSAAAERFPAGLEAAAYFVACEALTNAVKHAGATRAAIRTHRHDGRLVVCISDDGVGGATASGGSGLTGLADRVHAHGGSLTILSPPGAGTALTAEFPCAS
jgi:signal transduction histidine kinase